LSDRPNVRVALVLCYVAILCTLLCAEEEEEHGWSE